MVIASDGPLGHEYLLKYCHGQLGFTLTELMVVVAIIAILSVIAVPSYNDYIDQTNRVNVMTAMQQSASRIEANKLNYKRYDKIPLTAIFSSIPASSGTNQGSVIYPDGSNAVYRISITPLNNAKTHLKGRNWVLTASPVANKRMAGDGELTLSSTGSKCWKPSSASNNHEDKCGFTTEWID